MTMYRLFQSTPPGWEATQERCPSASSSSISIHASRVGGDVCYAAYRLKEDISIHASRVGGDPSEPSAGRAF